MAALVSGGFVIVSEGVVSIDGSVMPREIIKFRIYENVCCAVYG